MTLLLFLAERPLLVILTAIIAAIIVAGRS